MKKSMQKGWGLNISMIYLPINPKTILNFFSRIIEIQNTIQNLENIIITSLDSKGSFSLPPLPLNII